MAEEQAEYNARVRQYMDLKQEIGLSSGDFIDLKRYDSDMRFLIDNYISADDSERVGDMSDFTLLAYIHKKKDEAGQYSTAGREERASANKNTAETIIRKERTRRNPQKNNLCIRLLLGISALRQTCSRPGLR